LGSSVLMELICSRSRILKERLKAFKYDVEEIRVSIDVIPQLVSVPENFTNEYARIDALMTAGDDARKAAGDNSVLALGVAAKISSKRKQDETSSPPYRPRCAYIVNSLKHPDEVVRFREIYPDILSFVNFDSARARRLLEHVPPAASRQPGASQAVPCGGLVHQDLSGSAWPGRRRRCESLGYVVPLWRTFSRA
jgi:hypothetical protein